MLWQTPIYPVMGCFFPSTFQILDVQIFSYTWSATREIISELTMVMVMRAINDRASPSWWRGQQQSGGDGNPKLALQIRSRGNLIGRHGERAAQEPRQQQSQTWLQIRSRSESDMKDGVSTKGWREVSIGKYWHMLHHIFTPTSIKESTMSHGIFRHEQHRLKDY